MTKKQVTATQHQVLVDGEKLDTQEFVTTTTSASKEFMLIA